ncbi:MAG TPA: Hsp20/alpha crystallin family protein, partial [Clostridiales bacterium]|nr:Hsp20/alpha crystallin family protein [Clostridiales bacterium]
MFELMPFNRRANKLARSAFGDMTDIFDNFFNTFAAPYNGNFMRSDIKDKGNEYEIEVELPGVKKEDIGVDLQNGYLTVAVNTNEEKKEEKDNYIVQERRY